MRTLAAERRSLARRDLAGRQAPVLPRRYSRGCLRPDCESKRAAANGPPRRSGEGVAWKVLGRWLEDCVKPRSRPRTYALYKQQVNTHIVPALGEVVLEKLTPPAIQLKLIAAKLAGGLAPRTVCHIRAVLRWALGQAEKWLLVPRNAAKLTEPPRRRKASVRVFAPAEVKSLIAGCVEHRLGALYVTMLMTGLRLGEAFGLIWDQLDVDCAKLFVRQAVQRVDLPDGTSEIQVVEAKSDTSYRLVSLPASLLPIGAGGGKAGRDSVGNAGGDGPGKLRSKSAKSGDPNVRQLEPDHALVASARQSSVGRVGGRRFRPCSEEWRLGLRLPA